MKRLIVGTMMIICVILILFSSYSLAKSYSNYTSKEIREEYKKNNDIINELSNEELNAWEKEMNALLNLMTSNPQASYSNLKKEGNSDEYIEQQEKLFEKTQEDVYEDMEEKNNSSEIYTNPKKDPNTDPENASSSIDDMINDAKSFISQGKIKYANDDDNNLQNVSNTVYNILLVVGTSLAVIMGAVLGIKLMVSGVEQKAEVKKLLVPYVVGCIVIFGGFGIWKLAITILQGI